MLILPLPARPDWARPPLATLAIMLLCLLAFFMQGTDGQRYAKAWDFYQKSGIDKQEANAYLADLESRKETEKANIQRRRVAAGKFDASVRAMEDDRDFMQRLRNNQVIRPENPDYALWRGNRTHFENLRARVVTENYALEGQNPRLSTLFTHMFLHGDIMHLAGNMAVLFVVGYTVEAALGPLGFLALYLLGGLGAALPDLLLSNHGYRLSLGASGAISAVMAAYLVLFGRRRINFFYWLLFFFGTARWPALVILPVWLAKELLQRFVLDQGGNTNYLAHFAGFVSGALLIGAYRWKNKGRSASMVHQQDSAQAIAEIRQQAEKFVADMQFGPAALQYRKLFAEHHLLDMASAEEYLRIARLTRQTELLAEANRYLLKAAASDPKSITPARLAEALAAGPGSTPRLAPAQWESLMARLIGGRQFEAAEHLVLRLLALPETRAAARQQAGQLAEALAASDQPERAIPLQRLLSSQTNAT
jgi:membrane associated rhomboid family serine protease